MLFFTFFFGCAAAAVPEARRSVADHGQHPDERSELPIARHLHHPPLSDESVPAAATGEVELWGV